jgi:hypothetical protein
MEILSEQIEYFKEKPYPISIISLVDTYALKQITIK